MNAYIRCSIVLLVFGFQSGFALSADADGPILRGKIIYQSGKPLPKVRVVLYGGFATRFRGQETTTDSKGEYRFAPLRTGALVKRDRGGSYFYTGLKLKHEEFVPADGKSSHDLEVPMGDKHEEVRDFVMRRGGKISGKIIDPNFRHPVPNLSLRIYNGFFGESKKSFWAYAKTDAGGKFVSGPLFPGRYVIEINDNNFRGKYKYPKIAKADVSPHFSPP